MDTLYTCTCIYMYLYKHTIFPRIEAGVSTSFVGFFTWPLNKVSLYSGEAFMVHVYTYMHVHVHVDIVYVQVCTDLSTDSGCGETRREGG